MVRALAPRVNVRTMTRSPVLLRVLLLSAIAAAVSLAACKSKEAPPPPANTASAESLVARVDTCPGDGLWRPCVLTERMKRMGFDAKVLEADTTRVPFLSPPGMHYQIGKSGLLIAFYFADAESAERSWKALDTLRLKPASDTANPWPSQPTSIRSGNLVAAFFGTSATQIERIGLALRAGVPTPAK